MFTDRGINEQITLCPYSQTLPSSKEWAIDTHTAWMNITITLCERSQTKKRLHCMSQFIWNHRIIQIKIDKTISQTCDCLPVDKKRGWKGAREGERDYKGVWGNKYFHCLDVSDDFRGAHTSIIIKLYNLNICSLL